MLENKQVIEARVAKCLNLHWLPLLILSETLLGLENGAHQTIQLSSTKLKK